MACSIAKVAFPNMRSKGKEISTQIPPLSGVCTMLYVRTVANEHNDPTTCMKEGLP